MIAVGSSGGSTTRHPSTSPARRGSIGPTSASGSRIALGPSREVLAEQPPKTQRAQRRSPHRARGVAITDNGRSHSGGGSRGRRRCASVGSNRQHADPTRPGDPLARRASRPRRRRPHSRGGPAPARRRRPAACRGRGTPRRVPRSGWAMPRWLASAVRCTSAGGSAASARGGVVDDQAARRRRRAAAGPRNRCAAMTARFGPYSPGRQATRAVAGPAAQQQVERVRWRRW